MTCVVFISMNFLKGIRIQSLAILRFVGFQIFENIISFKLRTSENR